MNNSSKKVLIAEDDPGSRYMMTELLEDLGYNCEAVNDGQHAIDAIIANPDDYFVVLMDIHMPRTTGLEALKAVRSAPGNPPRDIPVYAMSADFRWQGELESRKAGFTGVLPKPISRATVAGAIAAHF